MELKKCQRRLLFLMGSVLSSLAFAQAEVECDLNGTRVKASPEACSKLGGSLPVPDPSAGPSLTAPFSTADELYAIWEQKRRTEHGQAQAAAKQYLTRFPTGSQAAALRAWLDAYERARLAIAAEEDDPKELMKTIRDLVIVDPRRKKTFITKGGGHTLRSTKAVFDADFAGCTLHVHSASCNEYYTGSVLNPFNFFHYREKSAITSAVVPVQRLDLETVQIKQSDGFFVVQYTPELETPLIKWIRKEYSDVRADEKTSFCEKMPNPGETPAGWQLDLNAGGSNGKLIGFVFADFDAAERFKSAFERFAKACKRAQ